MSKIWSSLGLAVLGIAILVGAAAATVDTDTQSVSATLGTSGSITATDVTDWTLSVGNPTTTGTVHVATNVATWTVSAIDNGGTATGIMSDGTNSLASPLTMKNTLGTYSSLASSVTVVSGSAAADADQTVYFQQPVSATDPASSGSGYAITVLYTLTY